NRHIACDGHSRRSVKAPRTMGGLCGNGAFVRGNGVPLGADVLAAGTPPRHSQGVFGLRLVFTMAFVCASNGLGEHVFELLLLPFEQIDEAVQQQHVLIPVVLHLTTFGDFRNNSSRR
ncbi:MAG TPA: hypothetical protein VHI72_07355, partial [Hyphomicrobiaceae bacterium]|nr:hypothetical protein [Hyphomicrobiaceae bacterium]